MQIRGDEAWTVAVLHVSSNFMRADVFAAQNPWFFGLDREDGQNLEDMETGFFSWKLGEGASAAQFRPNFSGRRISGDLLAGIGSRHYRKESGSFLGGSSFNVVRDDADDPICDDACGRSCREKSVCHRKTD